VRRVTDSGVFQESSRARTRDVIKSGEKPPDGDQGAGDSARSATSADRFDRVGHLAFIGVQNGVGTVLDAAVPG